MKARFLQAISDIPAEQWNALTGTDYPFLRHEFLLALEQSGCVSLSQGWQAQHLLIESTQGIVALMPLYVKQHSYLIMPGRMRIIKMVWPITLN